MNHYSRQLKYFICDHLKRHTICQENILFSPNEQPLNPQGSRRCLINNKLAKSLCCQFHEVAARSWKEEKLGEGPYRPFHSFGASKSAVRRSYTLSSSLISSRNVIESVGEGGRGGEEKTCL